MMEAFLFWAFALMAVPAALGVVFAKNLVYSAVSLLIVFLAVAGFFMLNQADFLAVAQIMVYAVGLTIVLLFGLMFTGDKAPPILRSKPWSLAFSFGAALAFIAFALVALKPALGVILSPEANAQAVPFTSSVAAIGKLLFNKYVLPFEVVSVLLLGAMIGAIVLSKRQLQEDTLTGVAFEPVQGRLSEAHRLSEQELHATQVSTNSTQDAPGAAKETVLVGSRQ